jgi:hypothetical protein
VEGSCKITSYIFLTRQQIFQYSRNSSLLWHPNIFYRVHNSPLLALISSKIRPIHTLSYRVSLEMATRSSSETMVLLYQTNSVVSQKPESPLLVFKAKMKTVKISETSAMLPILHGYSPKQGSK